MKNIIRLSPASFVILVLSLSFLGPVRLAPALYAQNATDSLGELTRITLSQGPLRTQHHCSPFPTGVTRTDYFIDVISTLPHYDRLPAQLDVHIVSPVYPHGRCPDDPIQAAILVHGSTIDAVSGFDLEYRDYSLMESLARAGVETFAVNLLGWGLSTRFGLDDACNASFVHQLSYLIPNPLSQPCDSPDPFHFTTSAAEWEQLDAVVADVQARLGVEQVSLFGWSGGGHVVGGYTDQNPSKVKNLVLLASAYNFPSAPPDPLPQPGVSLGVQDRVAVIAKFNLSDACPGQLDAGLLEPMWQTIEDRDPLGSTWGSTDPRTGGLERYPTQDRWGWNDERAANVHVPTLVLSGLLDNTVPTPIMVQLYNALGTTHKVLVKIACASHQMPWEGSTSPTWGGPHASLQDAVVQWITSETYQGFEQGTFQVNADGTIDGPF